MSEPSPEQQPVIKEHLSADDFLAQLKDRERRQRRWMLLLTIIPTLAGALVLWYVYQTSNVPELPENARLTVQAWNAFNAEHWDEAMARADACIARFGPIAATTQAQLTRQGEPSPPVGAVRDGDVRRTIANRGPLNDVATCWFIRGRAAENLGRTDVAKQAYEQTRQFPHARCWDPNGWFWAPAIAATERMQHLN